MSPPRTSCAGHQTCSCSSSLADRPAHAWPPNWARTGTPSHTSKRISAGSAAKQIRDGLDHGGLPPLRGFVGNAGVQFTNALTEGPEGLESTFTVNVLANHLFVRLLEDRFVPPARIVITVSDTHFGDLRHNLGMVPGPSWQSPDILARPGAFPRPQSTSAGRTAYSTSKLAAIYLVHEYARRLPDGVDAVAYNPAFVPGTGLARTRGRSPGSRCAASCHSWPSPRSRLGGRYLADVVLGRSRPRPAPTSTGTGWPGHPRSPTTRSANATSGTRPNASPSRD